MYKRKTAAAETCLVLESSTRYPSVLTWWAGTVALVFGLVAEWLAASRLKMGFWCGACGCPIRVWVFPFELHRAKWHPFSLSKRALARFFKFPRGRQTTCAFVKSCLGSPTLHHCLPFIQRAYNCGQTLFILCQFCRPKKQGHLRYECRKLRSCWTRAVTTCSLDACISPFGRLRLCVWAFYETAKKKKKNTPKLSNILTGLMKSGAPACMQASPATQLRPELFSWKTKTKPDFAGNTNSPKCGVASTKSVANILFLLKAWKDYKHLNAETRNGFHPIFSHLNVQAPNCCTQTLLCPPHPYQAAIWNFKQAQICNKHLNARRTHKCIPRHIWLSFLSCKWDLMTKLQLTEEGLGEAYNTAKHGKVPSWTQLKTAPSVFFTKSKMATTPCMWYTSRLRYRDEGLGWANNFTKELSSGKPKVCFHKIWEAATQCDLAKNITVCCAKSL